MSTYALDPAAARGVLADVLPGARVRDATLILAGVLFTAGLAQIEVPIPGSPVPISGQTLAVAVVGASLGARRGAAAMLLYALAGLVLPFYSGGESGVQVLFGATGGYILGFIISAAFVGYLAERGADRKVLTGFLAFVGGQALVFLPGVAVLILVTGADLSTGLAQGFTPFLVGGLIKALLAAILLPGAWKLVRSIDRG